MFEGFNLASGPYYNHIFDTEFYLGPGYNFSAPIDEVKYDYLNIASGPGHQPPGGAFVLAPMNGNLTGGADGLYPLWNGSYTPISDEIYENININIDWNWQVNPTLNDPPTPEQLYDFYVRYSNSYNFCEAIPGNEKYISGPGGFKFYIDKKLSRESVVDDVAQANIVGWSFYDYAIMGAFITDNKIVFNNRTWPTGSGSGITDTNLNININLPNQEVAISTFAISSFSVEPTKDFENATVKSAYSHFIYYIYSNPMTKLQATCFSSGRIDSTSFTCKSSGENFLKRFEIIFTGSVPGEFENIVHNEYDNEIDMRIQPKQAFANPVDDFGEGFGSGNYFSNITIAKSLNSVVQNYPLISKISNAHGISADQGWSVGTIKAT